MSRITTHVLDTARGRPAADMGVTLERVGADAAGSVLGRGRTDADGRLATLLPAGQSLVPGRYRLRFETGAWFASQKIETLYPEVVIEIDAKAESSGYHIPLLLNPYGYSTYRGS